MSSKKTYCKICAIKMSKIYYEKNKEKVLEKLKLKRLQNLDLYRENDKLKYEKNREKCLISMKKWKQNHKSEIKEYRNKYNFSIIIIIF